MQLVEVVDGVAGLVGGLGASDAQLVGLPDEVDVLGQPQVGAAALGAAGLGLGLFQQLRDLAQLRQHGAAGRLGGVRGEDGAHREVARGFGQVRGVGVLEHVGRAGEVAAVAGAADAQLAAPVDLLGDVCQVEVGGEGAHQLGRGLQVGSAQEGRCCFAVAAGQSADALDEVEELGAFLAYQRLAEQVAEPADVGAERGGRVGGLGLGRLGGEVFSSEVLSSGEVFPAAEIFSAVSGRCWLLSALLTGAAPLRLCFWAGGGPRCPT